MKRAPKVILWISGPIVVLLVAVFLVILWFVRRPFPDVRGTDVVAGISADIEIFRDEDGVPHIFATSMADLYFAQGYVHAQDRFWQMEFWRRIGSGTLSEILGESAVDQDRYLRTMGFERVAALEYVMLSDRQRDLIDAYADGVNAYILDRKPAQLGLEFALLGLTGVEVPVRPWTGVNSLTWGKVMALDLGLNMGHELSNLTLLRSGGEALFRLVRAPYRDDMPYIVQTAEVLQFRESLGLPVLETPDTPVATVYSSGLSGVGSNNWVIGPDRTATGAPILANDMHLAVQIPSIWYEIGLHMEPLDSTEEPHHLRGFSFPGVPAIIAGQNDSIAWGMTNLGGDVQDLFQEQVNPQNPDEYWDGSRWQPMEIRLETIHVEGRDEPVVHRVRSTPRGPILTDLPQLDRHSSVQTAAGEVFPEGSRVTELSLRWTALEPETLFAAIMDLNMASNAFEAREALRRWASPSQNLVFADDQGNIGYQSTGVFPSAHPAGRRAPGSGWAATDTGKLAFDDFPAVINPERGYIVTANNPVVEPDYPYPLGLDYSNGLRAARITELIVGAPGPIDFDYVAGIHADVFSRNADEVLSVMLPVDPARAYADWTAHREAIGVVEDDANGSDSTDALNLDFLSEAITVLSSWDREMNRDSAGAAAFGFVWKELIAATFQDEVPDQSWPFTSVSTFENVYYKILAEPGHPVWDDRTTPVRESQREILDRSIIRGLFAAREQLGDRVAKWKWGDVHQIEFRNASLGESGIGIIERVFNRGPFPLSGGASTVNVSHYGLDNPFDATTIVSERAIYDLSNPSNSQFTHPTGQSGHPFHRHYLRFFEEWRSVAYHPARWTRDEVEASSGRRKLLLQPE